MRGFSLMVRYTASTIMIDRMKDMLWKSMPFLLIVAGLCLSIYCAKGLYSARSDVRDKLGQLDEQVDDLRDRYKRLETKIEGSSVEERKDLVADLVVDMKAVDLEVSRVKKSYAKNEWQSAGSILGSLMSSIGLLWLLLRGTFFRSSTKKSA